MFDTVCCCLGHRKIMVTEALRENLYAIFENLILRKSVDTFLFGSKSQFNDLCYQVVSELKSIYPHIKRVYVRAKFPVIDDSYRMYLLESYEETYFPYNIVNAGRAAYVERNFEMINKSRFCVMYYDVDYVPITQKSLLKHAPKSGAGIAYSYAVKKKRTIINLFEKK